LFEAYAVTELLKAGVSADSLKFWQDKQKHEVDIVIDLISKQTAIEVKCKNSLKREDLIGLETFMRAYNPHKAYLVNLGVQKKAKNITMKLPYSIKP